MTDFEKVLLRLKEQLGVATDKEAAAVLGLSDKALNARKRRGAFPEDKLWALTSSRKDVDISYILTGVKKGQEHMTAAAQTMRVSVLASLLGDELNQAKTNLPYEVFYAVLTGLMQRYGDVPDFDVGAARKSIKQMLSK